MDNMSALSLKVSAPQGRAGPGIWEQDSDGGFIDFIAAVMGRSEVPAARVNLSKNAEPSIAAWTATHMGATAAAGKLMVADKDVESVVQPQHADSQEDLLQLIALLLGEEENDGFLCALERYILETPKLFSILESLPINTDKETKLADLLTLVQLFVQRIPENDLPPELAPLANLFMMFAPPEPTETNKMEVNAETAEQMELEAPELQGKPETVSAEKDESPAFAREIAETIRVTELKINSPRRAIYTDAFSAARAVLPAQAAEQTDRPEAAEAAEEPTVWDLTEEIDAASEKPATEPATDEKQDVEINTKPIAVPVQQAETPQQTAQTTEAAPARQVLAGRIIDQITAQAAKPLDVSVLQMELNPKFLGRIQLVIEATAEGLTAKLRSDNGATRSLLNEHIAELRSSLKEAGINMKDIEISEPRVSTQLSNRQWQQGHAEEAAPQKNKTGGLPAITKIDGPASTEPAAASYAIGRVSGTAGGDSQFDYRA